MSIRKQYEQCLKLHGVPRFEAFDAFGVAADKLVYARYNEFPPHAYGNLMHNFRGSLSPATYYTKKLDKGEPIIGHKTKRERDPAEVRAWIQNDLDAVFVNNGLSVVELIESVYGKDPK